MTCYTMWCRWVMYNQHQAALLELQQKNMHNQIDLKALSQPAGQVGAIQPSLSQLFVLRVLVAVTQLRVVTP